MNIAKKTCYSNSPSRLRRSVALISAAILLSTNAQAEIKIGRLPSTNAGSGEVIGAKPNVFIIIDNGKSMTGSKNRMEYDPDGNYLQQTAGALIAALPQLEGKVRLGYSTIFKGTYALSGINYAGKQLSCQEFKLNGNVDRLDPFIPGLKADLAKNPNYVTGAEDFVFNDSGSGYGNTVPRDFRDNYARYIYAWLGAMCMGSTSDKDSIPYGNPWNAPLVPPYADLKDKAAYKAAAIAANNKNSYPVVNFIGTNVPKKTHKPLIDMYARVLGQVSDEKFICSLEQNTTGGAKCIYTDLSAERGAHGNATLRNYPESNSWKYLTYDAYAPSRPDNGFPDDKNPLSCRKNYTIMISHGAYGQPSDKLRYNSKVGTDSWGIDGKGSADGWRMPNGREFPRSGPLGDITRMYRFLPIEGNSEVREIPKSKYEENGTHFLQGAGGKFLLSKMILQSYYQDLRSNLPDDVQPYIAGPTRRHGPGKKGIPSFWDRRNDPATWQHMTFFALGFTDDNKSSFPSWQYANEMYKPYYSDLDPEGGILEPYFRAIEDGTIYAENKPLYDWGRGGYGLKALDMSYYFYKNPTTQAKEEKVIAPPHFQGSQNLRAWGATLDMDYAKAGIIGRGGAYEITDYHSIKKVIKMIADRIETAMAQGITGGAVGGGGRITASSQTSTPNTLFATYVNEEELNGNVFAYRNCPVTPKKIPELNDDGSVNRDSGGKPIMIDNPEWAEQQCGKRLWNAATVLDNELKANPQAMAQKTIVPIKDASGTGLTGDKFTWATLDDALKTALKDGHDDATGQARVEWINGKLHSEFDATMQKKLRKRGMVAIPIEGQRYKLDGSGQPEKDPDGNLILADPTSIANRIGEIVYAVPKAVDNTGTLPSGHPLNVNIGANNYADFVKNTVRKRKPLVMAGSNDGHLYAFTDPGRDLNYAELAFSYIPRAVAIAPERLAKFTDSGLTAQTPPPNLVNGPFTVRDAQVDGKWGTYVVGTLGPATATNAVEGGTIYALDISNGRADNDIFKWEVNIAGTDGGNPNIMAEPRIVWLRKPCTGTATTCAVDGKWVVLVTSGYNATNTSLVVLDLKDGSELARINTGAMYTEDSTSTSTGDLKTCQLNPLKADNTDQNLANVHKSLMDVYGAQGKAYLPKASFISCDNGLGALTVFDADNDGGADYVFAGDLFGHVWKFDLTGFYDKNTGNQAANLNQALKVSYNSPLFVAQSPNKSDQVNDQSPRQPITAMIDIADGAYGEGSMLYIGTGRLFNQQERAFSQRQSYYGIWDIPRYTKQKEQGKISDNWSLPLLRDTNNKPYSFMQYEAFAINSSAVKETTSELKGYKELRGLKHKNWQDQPDMTYLSYDLEGGKSANPNAKLVGWSIDFPADNKFERVIERGRVFEDTLFFPSFEPPNDSEPQEQCTPDKGGVGGNGRFYMVDRMTGAQPKISPFDFTGDGSQSKEDGVELRPSDLGLTADEAKKAGYTVTGDNGNEVVSSSVAGILIGPVPSSFLTLDTVLGRVKLTDSTAKCDYNRQVIFPGTLDPVTGQPRILTSCNINRYRVWKQPIEE